MANNVRSAALSMERTTIATQKTAKATEPELPKLTLPQELRDQIYSYLLRNEIVRGKPYHMRPQNQWSRIGH